MAATTMNTTSRLFLACLLLAAAVVPTMQQQDVDEMDTVAKKRPNRRQRKDLYLAESFDSVTLMRQSGTSKTAAGDYSVWNNLVWSFDQEDNAPTVVIGTSRGTCVRLEDGDIGNTGHCTFTLTVKEAKKQPRGRGEDEEEEAEEEEEGEEEEEEVLEVSKLMVVGDVDSLEWEYPQTLAIVGGTGKYEAASGEIEIVAESGFLLYGISLD